MTFGQTVNAVLPMKDRLPYLTVSSLNIDNALARRRTAFTAKLPQGEVSFRICHPRAIATEGIGFARIEAQVDGTPVTIHVPARILTAIARQAKTDVNFADVSEEGRALLVEHALDGLLNQLESLGHQVSVTSIGNPARSPRGDIGCVCQFGALPPFSGLIEAPESFARWLLAESRKLPPAAPGMTDAPIEVRILVGVTRIPALRLGGLGVGDTVLFDHSWLAQRRLAVVVGGRMVFDSATSGRGVSLASRTPVTDARERKHWLDDEQFAAGADMDNRDTPDLDPLEVKLVFEMGRQSLSVAELGKLDVGHVFELNRAPDQAVDIFVMNRQIGSGELVMVGDKIGVRITRTVR